MGGNNAITVILCSNYLAVGLWEVKRQSGDYSSTDAPAESQAAQLVGCGCLCRLLLLLVVVTCSLIPRRKMGSFPVKADGGGSLPPGRQGSFIAFSPHFSSGPLEMPTQQKGRWAGQQEPLGTPGLLPACSMSRCLMLPCRDSSPVICSPKLFII